MIETYSSSISSVGALAVLMLAQLLVADVVGLRRKHVPGTAVLDDHDDLLFRASRTVLNTNESVAIFLCAFLFAVLSGASPLYIAYASWAYVVLRAVYALCYYANLQTLRSVSFGLSLFTLIVLICTAAFS